MSEKLPDLLGLEQALERIGSDYSASEVQGIAYGMLALNAELDVQAIYQQVLPQGADRYDYLVQETMNLLQAVFAHVQVQLADAGLSTELLLPDDGTDLAERVFAVQKWCQGLALGVAASGGLKSLDDLSQDSREWFEDVVRIGASGDFDLQEGDEESEQAYFEITEFIKVGLLMMNEEMQPVIGLPLQSQAQ